MAAYREILTSVSDHVLTITLNRPDRLNAWTGIMQSEVETAIRAGGADEAVRCIVITGAGRGFCAGADMNNLQTIQASAGEQYTAKTPDLKPKDVSPLEQTFPGRFGHMFACPKPIIAAINGPCAGIGLILTLFADLRYAATDAKFTTAFSQRGLIAEHGIAWQLPRLVGKRMRSTSCSRRASSAARKPNASASSTARCRARSCWDLSASWRITWPLKFHRVPWRS